MNNLGAAQEYLLPEQGLSARGSEGPKPLGVSAV